LVVFADADGKTWAAPWGDYARELVRARQLKGIAKAKLNGIYKGRSPTIDTVLVRSLRAEGLGATEIAQQLRIGRSSVYRVLKSATADECVRRTRLCLSMGHRHNHGMPASAPQSYPQIRPRLRLPKRHPPEHRDRGTTTMTPRGARRGGTGSPDSNPVCAPSRPITGPTTLSDQ
jgi:hypothetical protein